MPGLGIAAAGSGWRILVDWSGYAVVASVVSLNRDEYLDARRRDELQSIGWLGLWDDSVTPEQFGWESYGSCWDAPIDIYRLGRFVLRTAEVLGMSYDSIVVSLR